MIIINKQVAPYDPWAGSNAALFMSRTLCYSIKPLPLLHVFTRRLSAIFRSPSLNSNEEACLLATNDQFMAFPH